MSTDPFVINDLCDKQTNILLSGYIRKSINQTTQKNTDISALSIITSFYYYNGYFSPETYIKTDRGKTIIIKYDNDTLLTSINEHSNFNHDTIEIHEGKYDDLSGDETNAFWFDNESLYIKGIGDKNKIILNNFCIFLKNSNIHIENVTIIGDDKIDLDANTEIRGNSRLWLNKCVFKIKDTAIFVDEQSSLYVKDCIFSGYDHINKHGSESAILISPFADKVYIMNSKFEYCAKRSNFFGNGDDDYYSCVEIGCWRDETGKKASVQIYGVCNSFVNNYGYPFAKKLILSYALEDNGKIDWFECVKCHFKKNVVMTHCMTNIEQNELIDGNKLYSKLFVDNEEPHSDYENIARKTNSNTILTQCW